MAGVTRAQPTPAQLAAMAEFYVHHDGLASLGTATHLGCVVTSMAVRRDPDHRLTSYSQTLCQGCPLAYGPSKITPTVYTLKGSEVVSVKQADAPGYPMLGNQIARLFPPGLRYEANDQVIPDVNQVSKRADALADCQPGV